MQLRSTPSPGPAWETLEEFEDTPEMSSEDELEEESVLQDLLPASVLRKRKEQTTNRDNSARRPRVEQKEFSRDHDIPSGIQVTPRQHLSPGITRRSVGEIPAPSKLFNASREKSGHGDNNEKPSSSISNSMLRGTVTVNNTISVPMVARKRAARKRASSPSRHVQSSNLRSALTRVVKRTREEKKKQNSDTDDPSDLESLFPFSASLPASARSFNSKQLINGGKSILKPKAIPKKANNGKGKMLNKDSIYFSSGKLLSQRSQLTRMNVIDITLSDEEVPVKRVNGASTSIEILEISSDEDLENNTTRSWRATNGFVPKPQANQPSSLTHNTPIYDSPHLTLKKNETRGESLPGDANKNIVLGPPDVVLEKEGGVGSPVAVFGHEGSQNSHAFVVRGGSESPEIIKENAQATESDDELEYIDEPENKAVTHGYADIDIDSGTTVGRFVDEVPGDADLRNTLPNGTKSGDHETTIRMSSPDPMNIIGNENGIVISPSSRTFTPSWGALTEAKSCVEIDGFNVISWPEFRHDIKNFTVKYHLAQDLPHTLQDYINHMSEWTRLLPDMRTVFTAAVQENTALDEPDAPPIRVENDFDNEPTPPWEFHYSNYMWHGNGVPPPDMANLLSCDCIGRCDPRSKSCACIRRQQLALEDENADFAYDNKGRLKAPGFPIFECNDLCGCDDDCRNRVVQLGRTCAIAIKKTEHKGWGVFADQKKIYKGTFIGIYAGEILTDEEGEERGFHYNKIGRTYLFDIDFHHLRRDCKDWQSKYTVDAYHAGNFTRFLNHSCDPNCILNPCYVNEGNIEKPLLVVFARRDIEPGEELCFSYSGDVDDDGESMDVDDDEASDNAMDKNDAVYAKCYCGARNCKGRLFG